MNKMQQQQQAPQTMNSAPSTPLHLVSTEQIQKYLDENKNLIMAIMESQNMGKVAECAQYQAILQKNLTYLAAIADAHPPESAIPSQLPTSSVALQGNPHLLLQPQASTMHQQPGGPAAKMTFQLNALRPQDQQQNQLLQFQQLQGSHFSIGGGANNGFHLLAQPGFGNAGSSLMDLRGSQPRGLEVSSGDGQGKSTFGPLEGRE